MRIIRDKCYGAVYKCFVIVFFSLLCLCIASTSSRAQELFILSEPASNLPKGALAVRLIHMQYENNEPYSADEYRIMNAIRLAYGITGRWMIWLQPAFSNHHDDDLPPDVVNHYHIGTQTVFFSNTPQQTRPYPYRYVGTHFYTKYLFFKRDTQNDHLRASVYAEYSTTYTPHEEAEPNLYDDNQGWGAGLILTRLSQRWAVSYTMGIIRARPYEGMSGNQWTRIEYGTTFQYNLAFGYLLYPRIYEHYDQNNVNLYLELRGKQYPDARIYQESYETGLIERIPVGSELHIGQFYWEAHFGIQKIIRSNTRIDFSLGLPFYRRSYAHNYPLLQIQIQHLFFPRLSRP